jgi:hypothetical protein
LISEAQGQLYTLLPPLDIISKQNARGIQYIDKKRISKPHGLGNRERSWKDGAGTGPQMAQLHDSWMLMMMMMMMMIIIIIIIIPKNCE